MTQSEFMERLHACGGFGRAVLHKISVDKKAGECTFWLITDAAYTRAEEEAVRRLVREAVPEPLQALVSVQKLVADPQIVRRKIVEFLSRSHRAAAACISEEDIGVQMGEDGTVAFTFGVDGAERGFFEKNQQILPSVERMLGLNFCNAFVGGLTDKEKPLPAAEEEPEEEEPFDYRPPRTFAIENFEAIDSASPPKLATYIEDSGFQSASLTVCGVITSLQERVTKAKTDASGAVVKEGRPYLRLTVADATGALSFSYFPKKRTEEKIKALQEGDSVVCTGENELYNGKLSFTARAIDRGAAPEGFVPEKRESKPLPAHYTRVFPEKLTDYNQLNLFVKDVLPSALTDNVFVVLDIETTGLNNTPVKGKMDAITEIGAVKIVGGEVREKFTTLVDPQRKLSDEIVALTGITDEMLQGAPKIEEVIGDFCKFCDGCFIVGHNVQFDYKFLHFYAEQSEYDFTHKTYDTMSIAQGMLFLSNYKLNTLADYYHISFNHHRAWDDALTTAKIFIELIKAKKCLPTV